MTEKHIQKEREISTVAEAKKTSLRENIGKYLTSLFAGETKGLSPQEIEEKIAEFGNDDEKKRYLSKFVPLLHKLRYGELRHQNLVHRNTRNAIYEVLGDMTYPQIEDMETYYHKANLSIESMTKKIAAWIEKNKASTNYLSLASIAIHIESRSLYYKNAGIDTKELWHKAGEDAEQKGIFFRAKEFFEKANDSDALARIEEKMMQREMQA